MDSSFSSSTGTDPDITYRGNGGKFIIWEQFKKEINAPLFSQPLSMVTARSPIVTTSSGNQRDIYFTWDDQFDYDADSADIEKVVAIRELYP